MELVVIVVMAFVTWMSGRYYERKHYASIRSRESAWTHVPTTTFWKSFPHPRPVARVDLAIGSVVIPVSYFDQLVGGLRTLVGGEMKSFSGAIDRARREALLRMRESHPEADAFVDCHFERAEVGAGAAEVLAFGTAIYYLAESHEAE